MAVVKSKPTSAGRRHHVRVVHKDLHKADLMRLLEKNSKTGGRNNLGRITTRHIGGGHKHHYRVIDFKRTKDGIPAKVERIEYDPNRTAHIALLLFADGERRYIIAPKVCRRTLFPALRPSKQATVFRFVTSLWVPSFTRLSSSLVRVLS